MNTKVSYLLVVVLVFFSGCKGGGTGKATHPQNSRSSETSSKTSSQPHPTSAPHKRVQDARASDTKDTSQANWSRYNAKLSIPKWPKTRGKKLIKDLYQQGIKLWRRSCPIGLTYELCLKKGSSKTSWNRLKGHARNQYLENAALKRLRALIKIWHQLPKMLKTPPRSKQNTKKSRPALQKTSMAAHAMLVLADHQLEKFLAQSPPKNLLCAEDDPASNNSTSPRFGPWGTKDNASDAPLSKKSLKSLSTWFKRSIKTLTSLKKDYTKILLLRHPTWVMAALFRMGMLYEALTWHLAHPHIPKCLKTKRQRDTWRKEIQRFALPLKQKATKTYTLCISVGARHSNKGKTKKGASSTSSASTTAATSLSWPTLCTQRKKALSSQ